MVPAVTVVLAIVAPGSGLLISAGPFRRVLRSDNLRPALLGSAQRDWLLAAVLGAAPKPEGGA